MPERRVLACALLPWLRLLLWPLGNLLCTGLAVVVALRLSGPGALDRLRGHESPLVAVPLGLLLVDVVAVGWAARESVDA